MLYHNMNNYANVLFFLELNTTSEVSRPEEAPSSSRVGFVALSLCSCLIAVIVVLDAITLKAHIDKLWTVKAIT